MWQEMFLLLQGVLYASQEEYFLTREWFFMMLYFFLFLQWVFIPCVPTVFFLLQDLFFLWERIVFLWSLGHPRCITFLRQMFGIYNQYFVLDPKISWEPGSQVPRDSPTLAEIILICTNVTRTNVAWTNIAWTCVIVTVGICSRCSQEPTCKVSSKSGQ